MALTTAPLNRGKAGKRERTIAYNGRKTCILYAGFHWCKPMALSRVLASSEWVACLRSADSADVIDKSRRNNTSTLRYQIARAYEKDGKFLGAFSYRKRPCSFVRDAGKHRYGIPELSFQKSAPFLLSMIQNHSNSIPY